MNSRRSGDEDEGTFYGMVIRGSFGRNSDDSY